MTYLKTVAKAYHEAPLVGGTAIKAWQILADETAEHYNRLAECLHIERTSEPEPYQSAYAMVADIAQGHILLSTANSAHPLWDLEANTRFRLVHDVIGHGTTGAGFDWAGERCAYFRQLEHTTHPLAKLALFTEVIGQAAYALDRGTFGTQKAAILPPYLQWTCQDDAH